MEQRPTERAERADEVSRILARMNAARRTYLYAGEDEALCRAREQANAMLNEGYAWFREHKRPCVLNERGEYVVGEERPNEADGQQGTMRYWHEILVDGLCIYMGGDYREAIAVVRRVVDLPGQPDVRHVIDGALVRISCVRR